MPNATASPLVGHITAGGLYAILVGACIAILRRLWRFPGLCASLTAHGRQGRTIGIKVRLEAGGCLVEISDHGIGLASSALASTWYSNGGIRQPAEPTAQSALAAAKSWGYQLQNVDPR